MARLLVATSDTVLGEQLTAEAEAAGHACQWCVDGVDAVDAIGAETVDAVFLDINLAVFSGLEVAERVRADPNVPKELAVFLLSDDDVDPRVLERHGVTALFPKTHQSWQVVELLTRTLGDRI